ncbi:hypothetical protein EBZ80_02540 [bacterium]|nr:hypothetical protein [bacterium]
MGIRHLWIARFRVRHVLAAAALCGGTALLPFGEPVSADIALADEFQRVYRSPYFLGRGDTGVAVADDEDAIFYNPAGLAQGKGIFKGVVLGSPALEISSDTRSLISDLTSPQQDSNMIKTLTKHIGDNQHIGFSNFSGLLLRRAALGFVTSNETNVLVYKDPNQGGLEAVNANLFSTSGVTFTLADGFYGDRMMLGATIAYYKRAQAKLDVGLLEAQSLRNTDDLFGYGTASPVTLGAMFDLTGKGDKSLGITVHNLGDATVSKDSGSGSVDKLRQRIDIGYASSTSSKAATARVLVDYVDATGVYTTNFYKKLHIGGEIKLGQRLGATAGLNQGGPCAGLFTDLWIFRVDGGYYTEELGDKPGLRSDMRYFIRIKAGF